MFKSKRKFIACTEYVVDGNENRFATMMQETIDKMQQRGLEVEVQYQIMPESAYAPDLYTALIIGREVK